MDTNGKAQLLGKVSAWYPKEGRGWVFRHVADLQASGRIPVVQGEQYAFTFEDVLEGSNPVARNAHVLFHHGGKNKCGQWKADQVRILKNAASASDGAPGLDAAAMFEGKTDAPKAGSAKEESKDAARLKRKSKEFNALPIEQREEVVKKCCTRIADVWHSIEGGEAGPSNQNILHKNLVNACSILLPPRSAQDITDREASLYTAQQELRKLFTKTAKIMGSPQGDAAKQISAGFKYVDTLICKFEKSSGSKLAHADVGKYWTKLADTIKVHLVFGAEESTGNLQNTGAANSRPGAVTDAEITPKKKSVKDVARGVTKSESPAVVVEEEAAANAVPTPKKRKALNDTPRSTEDVTREVTKLAFPALGGRATIQEVLSCIEGDEMLLQSVKDIPSWQQRVESAILQLCKDTGKRRKKSASGEPIDVASRPVIYELSPPEQ